ncbi:uncharacterized protein VTP21DRAFT_2080 [Calcarisporiella thermophila]|uniref:uncharacterized protein n=1 Tax=Calcarisporiella thermophila TaxID=911321 RepID=UPI003741F8AC
MDIDRPLSEIIIESKLTSKKFRGQERKRPHHEPPSGGYTTRKNYTPPGRSSVIPPRQDAPQYEKSSVIKRIGPIKSVSPKHRSTPYSIASRISYASTGVVTKKPLPAEEKTSQEPKPSLGQLIITKTVEPSRRIKEPRRILDEEKSTVKPKPKPKESVAPVQRKKETPKKIVEEKPTRTRERVTRSTEKKVNEDAMEEDEVKPVVVTERQKKQEAPVVAVENTASAEGGLVPLRGLAGGNRTEYTIKGESGPAVVLVSNLDPMTSADDIKVAFSEFGEIHACCVSMDSNNLSGIAEVEFARKASALACIQRYHRQIADDRVLKVELVRERKLIGTMATRSRMQASDYW